MHISPFKGYIFNPSKSTFNQLFYDSIREDFTTAFDNGAFRLASDVPSYFILEIKHQNTIFTGLITLTSIQDYLSGKIRAHEQTIAKKRIIHKKLLSSRKAMIKPAAILINENQKLNTLLIQIKKKNNPTLSLFYPDATTRQRLWVVEDTKSIKKISLLINKEKKAIIADGHHRFASIAALNNSDGPGSILTAYFPSDQMNVFSFYRILKPLKHQSAASILKSVQNISMTWKKVKSIPKSSTDTFLLFHQKNTYAFTLKKNSTTHYPHAFQDQITTDIFKIKNESISKRVHFEESDIPSSAFKDLLNKKAKDFIFRLPSLNTNDVLHTKKLLPPKSTFFMPRIINGLVVYRM